MHELGIYEFTQSVEFLVKPLQSMTFPRFVPIINTNCPMYKKSLLKNGVLELMYKS
jgi:hypothetical protein